MPRIDNKRLQILTQDEINELYDRPTFNHIEREEYFALDNDILGIIKTMDKLETKLYFILLIGYFRAKPVIPKFQMKEAKEDIDYLRKTYFSGRKAKLINLTQSTRATLVSKMLSMQGFERLTSGTNQANLITRLQDVATICTDPKYVFDESIAFFGQQRIALPGYTTILDLITETLRTERQRTELILSQQMSELTIQKLNEVLNSKGVLNSLSGYKGSARDFSPSELKRELNTLQTIKDIYPELKVLVVKLGLSQGNLTYYASIIQLHSIYKIRRYPQWQGLLYLACYLYFRYRETNDNLVSAFCYLTRKHNEAARSSAKQRIAEDLEVVRDKLRYAGNILRYFVDDDLSDSTQFGEVRKKAFTLISKEDVRMISQHLDENDFDQIDYEWQYTDKKSRTIANSLRKLFIAIDVECETEQSMLEKQITAAKTELNQSGTITSIDLQIIKKSDRPYLIEGDKVNVKRFEFYLYNRVFKMLDADKIYVTESSHNKRLEDDLITTTDWEDKDTIIQKTGLTRLIDPIHQTLTNLEKTFQAQLKQVTADINADANEFVKRQPRSNKLAWTLANKRWKEDVDNPIYSQVQHMGIIDIMGYVNQKTDYLSAFKNVASRKRGVKASDNDLIACVFGNGANYGLYRIATASDRSIGTLRATNDAHVRPETTSAANDLVSNAIADLSIFKYYTIDETAPFASIDGQKHACRINTFKARFSAKYFRKGKGVSALTLVSNHVPLNTAVISPNEYEGHYAFDLLYNNTSDIQPKSLATDTHGINNVNFAMLDMFGYQFTPRYAKFKHAFYDQFEIIPGDEIEIRLKKPINGKLIEQEWDQIQRIVCSLSRKTTTQSTVIRKLSNNKRNIRTLAALHEYDRLLKCLYFLEYIDNKTLRHFVQQALNRGEAYHQLRRTIASINGNQFRGGNDYQIEQWNDCARLIANCIIYYNSALLSGLVDRFEARGEQKVIDMITNLSPVAWSHIQLSGHYTFGDQKIAIDLDRLLVGVDPFIGIAA